MPLYFCPRMPVVFCRWLGGSSSVNQQNQGASTEITESAKCYYHRVLKIHSRAPQSQLAGAALNERLKRALELIIFLGFFHNSYTFAATATYQPNEMIRKYRISLSSLELKHSRCTIFVFRRFQPKNPVIQCSGAHSC